MESASHAIHGRLTPPVSQHATKPAPAPEKPPVPPWNALAIVANDEGGAVI